MWGWQGICIDDDALTLDKLEQRHAGRAEESVTKTLEQLEEKLAMLDKAQKESTAQLTHKLDAAVGMILAHVQHFTGN